jgi:hypothetical protein
MLLERIELAHCNRILLVLVFLCEERAHVFDECASDSRWRVGRFSDNALSSSAKPGGIFGGVRPSLALQSGQGLGSTDFFMSRCPSLQAERAI